jgi:hypothetical protein
LTIPFNPCHFSIRKAEETAMEHGIKDPPRSCAAPKAGPIVAAVRRAIGFKDGRNGNPAGSWGTGVRVSLAPRLLRHGTREPELWLLEPNGYGLPRRAWLEHWHEDRVELLRIRSGKARDYFNVSLRRDVLYGD